MGLVPHLPAVRPGATPKDEREWCKRGLFLLTIYNTSKSEARRSSYLTSSGLAETFRIRNQQAYPRSCCTLQQQLNHLSRPSPSTMSTPEATNLPGKLLLTGVVVSSHGPCLNTQRFSATMSSRNSRLPNLYQHRKHIKSAVEECNVASYLVKAFTTSLPRPPQPQPQRSSNGSPATQTVRTTNTPSAFVPQPQQPLAVSLARMQVAPSIPTVGIAP